MFEMLVKELYIKIIAGIISLGKLIAEHILGYDCPLCMVFNPQKKCDELTSYYYSGWSAGCSLITDNVSEYLA
jgi:hypothetical protein